MPPQRGRFVAAVLGSLMLGLPAPYHQATSSTWSTPDVHITGRAFLGATTGSDGKIYLFGGGSTLRSPNIVATAEVYDPATRAESGLASMPTERQGLAATTGPDGRLY